MFIPYVVYVVRLTVVQHLLGGMPFRLHVLHSSIAYFGGTSHITGGLVFWEPLTWLRSFASGHPRMEYKRTDVGANFRTTEINRLNSGLTKK